MRIMIVDFIRHNCWGTTDWATHYYVDGRRIGRNAYYRCYSHVNEKKWRYEDTREYTKEKDGITRNYTVMTFSPR